MNLSVLVEVVEEKKNAWNDSSGSGQVLPLSP